MSSKGKNIQQKWDRKKKRIKSSLKKGQHPRLVVFRSNKNIYVQIVDDIEGKTLASASSVDKNLNSEIQKAKSKLDKGIIVGKMIGEIAGKQNITKVIFDRNGYKYHGRIKALAEAVRETGIQF